MGPRRYGAADVVSGLREHPVGKARAQVVRLAAADRVLYDFGPALDRQQDRLLDLQAGRDVLVYRFEVPRELQPPRDGHRVFTLRGDRLAPAQIAGPDIVGIPIATTAVSWIKDIQPQRVTMTT